MSCKCWQEDLDEVGDGCCTEGLAEDGQGGDSLTCEVVQLLSRINLRPLQAGTPRVDARDSEHHLLADSPVWPCSSRLSKESSRGTSSAGTRP